MNENNNLHPTPNDNAQHVASFPDMSTHVQTDTLRSGQNEYTHVETRPDNVRFTLSVEEASELLAQAGVPRSPKTVTRFCKDGQLEFTKAKTEKNYKFLIDPKSLERLIKELQQTKGVNADSDTQSSHVQTERKKEENVSTHVETHAQASPDMSGQHREDASRETATRVEVIHLDDRERELLERMLADREIQIKSLSTDKEDLREQIKSEREMRRREQEMHMEQVKLLAASDRDTKGVTKTIANLINNIWPGTKGASGGETPISLSPVMHDVKNDLDGDEA